MTILVSYSPTLYRLFCAATGLWGTTQRSLAAPWGGASVDAGETPSKSPMLTRRSTGIFAPDTEVGAGQDRRADRKKTPFWSPTIGRTLYHRTGGLQRCLISGRGDILQDPALLLHQREARAGRDGLHVRWSSMSTRPSPKTRRCACSTTSRFPTRSSVQRPRLPQLGGRGATWPPGRKPRATAISQNRPQCSANDAPLRQLTGVAKPSNRMTMNAPEKDGETATASGDPQQRPRQQDRARGLFAAVLVVVAVAGVAWRAAGSPTPWRAHAEPTIAASRLATPSPLRLPPPETFAAASPPAPIATRSALAPRR